MGILVSPDKQPHQPQSTIKKSVRLLTRPSFATPTGNGLKPPPTLTSFKTIRAVHAAKDTITSTTNVYSTVTQTLVPNTTPQLSTAVNVNGTHGWSETKITTKPLVTETGVKTDGGY